MIKRCPFCGEKILPDDLACGACGKSFGKPSKPGKDRSPTNLDSWSDKSIPAWVMYSIIGLAVICVVLMAIEGCNK